MASVPAAVRNCRNAQRLGRLGGPAVATMLLAAVVLPGAPARAQSVAGQPTPPPLPGDYYAEAAGKSGQALRAALASKLQTEKPLSLSGIWSVVTLADRHDSASVLTVYRNAVRPAGLHDDGELGWEREHAWPEKHLPTSNAQCDHAKRDAHNLFAADEWYNWEKSDRKLGFCEGDCVDFPADNTSDTNKAGLRTNASGSVEIWEVWGGRRGDIARAMFYMDVRYEGLAVGTCTDPDLVLTDDTSLLGGGAPATPGGPYYYGLKCDLAQWHLQDPVSERERWRNHVVFTSQGNRNPFVDHPEWVAQLWPECYVRLFLPVTLH